MPVPVPFQFFRRFELHSFSGNKDQQRDHLVHRYGVPVHRLDKLDSDQLLHPGLAIQLPELFGGHRSPVPDGSYDAACQRVELRSFHDAGRRRIHHSMPIHRMVVLCRHTVVHGSSAINLITLYRRYSDSVQHLERCLDQCELLYNLQHSELSIHELERMVQYFFLYRSVTVNRPQLHGRHCPAMPVPRQRRHLQHTCRRSRVLLQHRPAQLHRIRRHRHMHRPDNCTVDDSERLVRQ